MERKQSNKSEKQSRSITDFHLRGWGGMSTDGSPERSETDGRSRGSQSGRGIKFPSTGGDGAVRAWGFVGHRLH